MARHLVIQVSEDESEWTCMGFRNAGSFWCSPSDQQILPACPVHSHLLCSHSISLTFKVSTHSPVTMQRAVHGINLPFCWNTNLNVVLLWVRCLASAFLTLDSCCHSLVKVLKGSCFAVHYTVLTEFQEGNSILLFYLKFKTQKSHRLRPISRLLFVQNCSIFTCSSLTHHYSRENR